MHRTKGRFDTSGKFSIFHFIFRIKQRLINVISGRHYDLSQCSIGRIQSISRHTFELEYHTVKTVLLEQKQLRITKERLQYFRD